MMHFLALERPQTRQTGALFFLLLIDTSILPLPPLPRPLLKPQRRLRLSLQYFVKTQLDTSPLLRSRENRKAIDFGNSKFFTLRVRLHSDRLGLSLGKCTDGSADNPQLRIVDLNAVHVRCADVGHLKAKDHIAVHHARHQRCLTALTYWARTHLK